MDREIGAFVKVNFHCLNAQNIHKRRKNMRLDVQYNMILSGFAQAVNENVAAGANFLMYTAQMVACLTK